MKPAIVSRRVFLRTSAAGAATLALSHFSNISYRVGKQALPDAVKAAFAAQPAAAETLNRFTTHLAANGITLDTDQAQLGMPLRIDPATLTIADNDAASMLLTRTYRAPFIVPENV